MIEPLTIECGVCLAKIALVIPLPTDDGAVRIESKLDCLPATGGHELTVVFKPLRVVDVEGQRPALVALPGGRPS